MTAAPIQEKARGNGQVTTGQRNQEQTFGNIPASSHQDLTRTAGRGLFYHPSTGSNRPEDIRFELEKKLAACVATGGTNGYPVQPSRIQNPCFRSLVFAGMNWGSWSITDLTQCTDRLEGAATLALLATLEHPVWGQSDYLLFEALERLEQLKENAWRGGRTL